MLEMSNDVQNPGAVILRINVFMTSVFAVASILSAVLFRQPWKGIAVVVSLVCFSVGVVVFVGILERSAAQSHGQYWSRRNVFLAQWHRTAWDELLNERVPWRTMRCCIGRGIGPGHNRWTSRQHIGLWHLGTDAWAWAQWSMGGFSWQFWTTRRWPGVASL